MATETINRKFGQFSFSGNFEVHKDQPLDSRTVVKTIESLYLPATWVSNDDSDYLYNGMVVAVTDDKALYMLVDKTKYQSEAGWKRLDADAAAVTEIIDNLTSTADDKALSANQGKVLKGLIDGIDAVVNGDADTEGTIASQIKAVSDTIEDVSGNLNTLSDRVDIVEETIDTTIKDKLSSLTDVYIYKGTVDTFEELPTENVVTGHVWNVVEAHGNNPAGTNYVWNGTEWDALGGSVDLSAYAKTSDVDTAIDGVNTTISSLSDRVDDVESDIETIIAENITRDSSINNLTDTIETITGEGEGSLVKALDDLKQDVEDNYVQLTTYNTAINGINTKINTNSSLIETINNDNATRDTSITALESALDNYVEKEDGYSLISDTSLALIGTNANNITAISTKLVTIDTSINTLMTNVSTNNTTLLDVSTRVTNLELIDASTRLNKLEEKLQWATLE